MTDLLEQAGAVHNAATRLESMEAAIFPACQKAVANRGEPFFIGEWMGVPVYIMAKEMPDDSTKSD